MLPKAQPCWKHYVLGTGAWPTILMSLLIRFSQDKGQIVRVLEIDHNGQVTGGVNANGAPTGGPFNGPPTLMAFDSIRIKAGCPP